MKHVVVVGAGVIGLTCAIRILEEAASSKKPWKVTIVAEKVFDGVVVCK